MTDRETDTETSAPNEPNEYGFAGDPTTPEPERAEDTREAPGEDVAVPAGDLTGSITGAIEDLTDRDDEKS